MSLVVGGVLGLMGGLLAQANPDFAFSIGMATALLIAVFVMSGS